MWISISVKFSVQVQAAYLDTLYLDISIVAWCGWFPWRPCAGGVSVSNGGVAINPHTAIN